MARPTIIGYIYEIRRTGTKYNYIGKTTDIEPDRRYAMHCHSLRSGRHSSPLLQAAWKRHGEKAFHFRVLDAVVAPPKYSPEDRAKLLSDREMAWFLASTHTYNNNRPGMSSYILKTLEQHGSRRPTRTAKTHLAIR